MEQQVTALSIIDSIDNNLVGRTMDKIHSFQVVIQNAVKPGHDIGIIPGTNKPTLLKPGAEKIVMMMGLSSRFEIMDKTEDYDKGFFAYNIRCTLSRQGLDICEGVGNCNSRESKYIKSDPYSIANTILKMAKKRAYIDAALSVASLSDVFTQDLEDMPAEMMIQSNGPSHTDNQGKGILEMAVTFGKNKGKTFAELLKEDHGYVEWLAFKSDNQRWSPLAKQALEAETANHASEVVEGVFADVGTEIPEEEVNSDFPGAVVKMADKAGMSMQDLTNYIEVEFGKPWSKLSGTDKSKVTKHLSELGQAG